MIVNAIIIILSIICPNIIGKSNKNEPIVSTKYGQLRGKFRNIPGMDSKVAVYLGVPYATPPTGANRFSPTRTLSQWVGIYEATSFGPSCPQEIPNISNNSAASNNLTMHDLQTLRWSYQVLKHQKEDCLYLNIYVPYAEYNQPSTLNPVLVYVHGPSYKWGSASMYDGSVLAARGKIIVVTLNYRLGILGFFNPNVDAHGRATVANYGLMDQLAALHWVQENIVHFGGDPGQVTVMGHGTGAACLNFLILSPAASGATLFKRAILMSGSALSPWAYVENPAIYAIETATQLGCDIPVDIYMHYESLLHCLRDKTVDQLLKVNLETPQFRIAIGPSIDGVTIKPDWQQQLMKMGSEGRTPVDLLLGVSEMDIFQIFGQTEAIKGFSTDYRDRVLRTFVTNNYRYHLQEVLLAVTAEYTDWTKPVQNEQSVRDLTANALHDAGIIAPMSSLAVRLSSANRKIFYYVFSANTGKDHNHMTQRKQSITEILYIFGAPLGAGWSLSGQKDYSRSEVVLSEALITYWTNFVKTGNPNDVGSVHSLSMTEINYRSSSWPKYDPMFKKYLEFGGIRSKPKDHYRATKVALWTWLLPNLERVGSRYGFDSSFHQLPDSNIPESFSGPTRSLYSSRQDVSSPFPISTTTNHPSNSQETFQDESLKMRPPDVSAPLEITPDRQESFTYTTALTLTVTIGCSLLILNILVFAAVYYRRDSSREYPKQIATSTHAENDQHTEGIKKTLGTTRQYTSSSPSHCSTLRSSVTLRSTLANSCDDDVRREWPPDYTSCCLDGIHPTLHNTHQIELETNGNPVLPTPVSRQPPPLRASLVPPHGEDQALLSPVALLQDKRSSNITSHEIKL